MTTFAMFAKTIQRHPLTSAFDVALFVTVMTAALVFVFTYDLASFWSHLPPRERQISLEEALLLASLAIIGICVFVWRRVLEERQDRAQRAESLHHQAMAMIDPLTSLPNRRQFMAALEQATARPNNADIAVCLLDLDGFKHINDRHGHQAGDAVLRVVAERFKAVTRAGDLLARLGGDEFALIAHGITSPPKATEVAGRFVEALRHAIQVGDQSHAVGVSVGIALCPQNGATPLDVLHSADVAMYEAKQHENLNVLLFRGNSSARYTA